MKDAIYDKDKKNYLRTVTNRTLARVKAARKDIVKFYLSLLASTLTFIVGSAIIAFGSAAVLDNSSNGEGQSSYPPTYNESYVESLENLSGNAGQEAKYWFSEFSGAIMSLAGLIMSWRYLSKIKLEKQNLEDERELLKKLLCEESEFVGFIRTEGYTCSKFLSLEPKLSNKIVDKFIENSNIKSSLMGYQELYSK